MSLATPRNLVLIIVSAAIVYLIGNARVSLWDRDEPRYAQTSRQMLQSGDWVVPRFLDKVRTAKPVFIYWCQAASMALLGDEGNVGVFAARLPSVLAMLAVLIIFAVVLWKYVGPEHAFWTVLILASSALVVWSAKACTTDAVLLLGITVAQLCLYALSRGHASWPVVIVFAVAVAQAGLTKGPVVLGVMGTTLLILGGLHLIDRWRAVPRGFPLDVQSSAFDVRRSSLNGNANVELSTPSAQRRIKSLSVAGIIARACIALLIIAALTGPWLFLVDQRESAFLGTGVSHDVLKRIAQPLEGHSGPPGYHLVLIFATLFPWSLLLPMAIVFAWKNRSDPRIRFALAAVVGPWAMFEIVSTKLPHYMLPTFPPLAFLAADAVVRCLRGEQDDLRRRRVVIGVAIIGVVAVAGGIIAVMTANHFGESMFPAAALLVMAIVFATGMVISFASHRPQAGLLAMAIGTAGIYLALFAVYLPRADFLRLSPRIAHILHRQHATGEGQSIMLDYKEPSLAFYQGGTIRENSAMSLSQDFLERAPNWLVVTDDVWAKTPPEARNQVVVVGAARGVAYADGGRLVNVLVLRKR